MKDKQKERKKNTILFLVFLVSLYCNHVYIYMYLLNLIKYLSNKK